jgi:capsule polysaccharide export protein KpsC/LpsZ
MAGSRPRSFYDDLRRLPGVVLVAPDVPIRPLIEKAGLIATVTGTIGLEAFLLDKPCVMFGRNFFAHLCHRGDKIDGLRDDIAALLANHRPTSQDEKVEAIARLYNVSYPFAVFEPYYRPEALSRGNIENFLDAMHDHLARLVGATGLDQAATR